MKNFVLFLAAFGCSLAAHAQKQLWGMTASRDSLPGVIFHTDGSGNQYTHVHVFDDTLQGMDPHGSLLLASDGNLYGLTSSGGIYGLGTLFRFDPVTGTYTKKHDFNGTSGQHPYGSLVQASNGNLYGMTFGGGAINRGILFSYDIHTEVFTKRFDFRMREGANPYGTLFEASDGYLYGLSSLGGGDATGALFRFDPALDTVLLGFGFVVTPQGHGHDPRGSLIQASDGFLYGFSRYGKVPMGSGGGVLFRFDPTSPMLHAFTPLHRFDETSPGAEDGFELTGSLIEASDGLLYGMTQLGGIDSAGTLFSFDPVTDSIAKLYDFQRSTDGYNPYGSLMQASNGKLYGLTTSEGGQAKLFEWDIATGTLNVKADVAGVPYYTALIERDPTASGTPEPGRNSVIRVFPNPAQDQLHVLVPPEFTTDAVQITDATGKTVRVTNSVQEPISLNGLTAGVYLIQITSGKDRFYERFVKQ